MDPPDDNFSFDFFDEEPARPARAQGVRGRLPQRAGGGRAAPPRQLRPLVRLTILVFFVTFILLAFSLLVASCAGESRASAYKSYMQQVQTIAQQSSADGASAVGALTTPGLTVSKMVSKLEGIAATEQQNLQAARSLTPPGRLRTENQGVVEALELRVLGLQGLAATFAHAAAVKSNAADEALALSQQAYRLLASDIVWDAVFLKPAGARLASDGVSGVDVPESHFLENPNLIVTPDEMELVVTRIIAGAPTKGTCSGLHGTGIVSVEALPNGLGGKPEVLQSSTLNTVTTSSNLLFQVTINDEGDFQEVHIPIQLVIARTAAAGGPITKTSTVDLIDPGQNASVTFNDLGNVPFASQTTVTVDVAAVCGETDLSNNHAQYNVIFSLPG